MKKILKSFAINIFVLWLVQNIVLGLEISGGVPSLLIVALALTLLDLFVKPILKILFIPINLATLGLFSLVINALILFILDYFLTQITVSPWTFAGFSYNGFSIPEINFGIIGTYFAGSFIISLLATVLKWL